MAGILIETYNKIAAKNQPLKEWLDKNVQVLNDDAFVCCKQNSKIDSKQFIEDVMKEMNIIPKIKILEDNFPSMKNGNITPLAPQTAKLIIKLFEEGRKSIYTPQRRML